MPSHDAASHEPSESLLRPLCAVLALAVPLGVTALRVASAPQWRDDVAVVQALGFVPVGGEGVPSSMLAALATLLPIGGRVLRAGLVGALGVALAGSVLFSLALRLLSRQANVPRLAAPLALAAALTATLSPTFQHEGTAAGGATFAVSLGLALMAVVAHRGAASVREAFATGALFGVLLAESHVTSAVIAATLVARALVTGKIATRRNGLSALLGAAMLFGFFLVPLFVRPLAEHTWVTLSVDPLSSGATNPLSPVFPGRLGPLSTWANEMGPVALGLGIGGLVLGLMHRSTRPVASMFAVLVVADALLPARGPSALTADRFAPLGLLAVAALAVSAAMGVQSAALALRRARIPLAVPASILLVVFHFTLVFAAAETSSDVVTESTGLGADAWTDEALGEVPPGAVVLVRSTPVAWRLWAARVARGERPDVIVVPLALVGNGTVAAALVREEPALAPLVRDIAMTGKASEYALTNLADTRPVFVDLDPAWDKQLLDHLLPTPLWLAFTPHTLGRSDRTAALENEEGRRALHRIIGVANAAPEKDSATLSVLGSTTREQAAVLAALGDRDSARRVLTDLGRIEPRSSFAAKLTRDLDELDEKRGHAPIDARTLLE